MLSIENTATRISDNNATDNFSNPLFWSSFFGHQARTVDLMEHSV